MFDSPFDFIAIVIAIVAFIIARKAMNEVAALRSQLALMQRFATPTAAERPVPPPLTPEQAVEQAPASSGPSIAPGPPPIPEQESISAAAMQTETPTGGPASPAAAPPPLPQRDPGFEERIGTRWIVWIGGLTLALGGFFMVSYSI